MPRSVADAAPSRPHRHVHGCALGLACLSEAQRGSLEAPALSLRPADRARCSLQPAAFPYRRFGAPQRPSAPAVAPLSPFEDDAFPTGHPCGISKKSRTPRLFTVHTSVSWTITPPILDVLAVPDVLGGLGLNISPLGGHGKLVMQLVSSS
ncbi:hypothetical protein B0T25DRAFT_210019 [Lasiosphaeria hispida]|uniref:Uncharacterized protein n=1 Tax=Lasiosphaeria hispida TaxID=260671 RepID=A0AAJ0MEP8_9PEZI|nr:hypothetical protein B0T25DRAFT_210019 [Lasiosphaeria hispida]